MDDSFDIHLPYGTHIFMLYRKNYTTKLEVKMKKKCFKPVALIKFANGRKLSIYEVRSVKLMRDEFFSCRAYSSNRNSDIAVVNG